MTEFPNRNYFLFDFDGKYYYIGVFFSQLVIMFIPINPSAAFRLLLRYRLIALSYSFGLPHVLYR